jgi:hypothetical protein
MGNIAARVRVKQLQMVFAHGRSPLLNCLAQVSVLYEDLRIETFALSADEEQIKLLDCLDRRYRVHYFLRRSIATVLEFRGALEKISRTDEYKRAKKSAFHQDAPDSKKRQRDLYAQVLNRSRSLMPITNC